MCVKTQNAPTGWETSPYLLILKHTGYIADLLQPVEEDFGDRELWTMVFCGPEKKSNLKIFND